MSHDIEREIDQNFDFFQRTLSDYLPDFDGKFALLRRGSLIRFFDSPAEAEAAGEKEFNDGLYSIQQVSQAPADLGFYSYAFNQGQAR
jgi:hypothetical protein